MPVSVIKHVNEMAKDQPKLLTFTNRYGNEIGDDDKEVNPPETPHKIPGVVGDTTQIPGVDTAVAVEDIAKIKMIRAIYHPHSPSSKMMKTQI